METLSKLSLKALQGGGGGTNNYNELSNQPQVNGNTLVGNKTTAQLGITDGIELYINPATNVMTIKLKSGNATVSEQSETIPTASVVQNAYFDYTTQELVIIFTNGSELRLPFGELVGDMLPMAFNIQLASAGWQQITGTDNYELDLTQAINYILSLIPVYNVVTPEGTENPSEEGWYEKNGQGQYVLTQDTSVVEGKTYYELLHKTLTYNTKFDLALNNTNQSILDTSECEQIYFETYLDNGTPKLRAIAVDNSPANDIVVQFTMTQIIPNLQGQPLLSNAICKSGKNYVEKNLFLNKLYPKGSIIMTYNKVSPATYIGGTWDLISEGYYPVATAKEIIDEQNERYVDSELPNVKASVIIPKRKSSSSSATYDILVSAEGAFSVKDTANDSPLQYVTNAQNTPRQELKLDLSKGNSTYKDNGKVQPKSVLLYMWVRTDEGIIADDFQALTFNNTYFDVSQNKEITFKPTTSITAQSTDTQVPSAKAVYDLVDEKALYLHNIYYSNIAYSQMTESGLYVTFSFYDNNPNPCTKRSELYSHLNAIGLGVSSKNPITLCWGNNTSTYYPMGYITSSNFNYRRNDNPTGWNSNSWNVVEDNVVRVV